jgi:hypothetical protein
VSRSDLLLLVISAVGLGACLAVATQRLSLEKRNRTVSVVLEAEQVEQLAALTGQDLETLLRKFRAEGATALALTEQTIDDLERWGLAAVAPVSLMLMERGEGAREGIFISLPDARVRKRVAADLAAKAPSSSLEFSDAGVAFYGSRLDLEQMGLGFDQDVAAAAKSAGLHIVARPRNFPGLTSGGLSFCLADSRRTGARLVLFYGEEVLGYRGLVRATARELRRNRELLYGSVELAIQKGCQALGRELKGRLARVHSISAQELSGMSPEEAAARFVRAATERNVRVCYVRLFLFPQAQPVRENLRYVGLIARGLERKGFHIGAARPMRDFKPDLWLRLVIAAGAAAAAVLLLGQVAPLSNGLKLALLAASWAVGAGIFQVGHGLLWKEKALLSAVVFPSLALVWLWRILDRFQGFARPARAIGMAAGCLAFAWGVSLGGGLMVAGLLSERIYFVKVDQFLGTKLAMILPLLIAAAVLTGDMRPAPESWKQYFRRTGRKFSQALSRPVLLWEAVASICILAAGVFLILRTGNEPGVGVSPLELKARMFLETVLGARPRLKEFLFGYPALFLACSLHFGGRRRWSAPLVVAGGVGLVSTVNSFCHLHTPLAFSFLRAFNGFWLGAVVGAVLSCLALAVARSTDAENPTGRASDA